MQSYGGRCVKPPILFGDVSRPASDDGRWWRHAQSLTQKPVKGMLTGPVTILQWSFVRDDQPRAETCRQVALAMRDEVADLEAAGIAGDPGRRGGDSRGPAAPAGMPDQYLRWAVDCFRLSVAPACARGPRSTLTCATRNSTRSSPHRRLDADVISIEASRSGMELLDVFAGIPSDQRHRARASTTSTPRASLRSRRSTVCWCLRGRRVGRERLWANPDCGLKTRRWEEALPALEHLVAAARQRRAVTAVAAGGNGG